MFSLTVVEKLIQYGTILNCIYFSTVDFRSTYMKVNNFLYINMNTDYKKKSKFPT